MATCFCVGPPNGQPLCPCMMRRVRVRDRDGRDFVEIDLGPFAPEPAEFRPVDPMIAADLGLDG